MSNGWKFVGWNTYGNISTWTDFPEILLFFIIIMQIFIY